MNEHWIGQVCMQIALQRHSVSITVSFRPSIHPFCRWEDVETKCRKGALAYIYVHYVNGLLGIVPVAAFYRVGLKIWHFFQSESVNFVASLNV